jgi:transposase
MAAMRGDDRQPDGLFSYVSTEQRVPQDHPLRTIRLLTDEVLREMSPEFDRVYARIGRPSVPPERLLRALLLQMFYSVRSERLLMEQLDDNLLFRWFVGLEVDEPIWSSTVFAKNRDRLLNQDIARSFFAKVVAQAEALMSDEHFTVDGTLIEAWASHKSFQPTDGPPPPDGDGRSFHGQRRSNATHASTTDPDAKLYRRSHHGDAKLAYLGHLLIENRHGLIVNACATQADGFAEREAALRLLLEQHAKAPRQRRTVGADKGYDTRDFVHWTRTLNVTPHVARNTTRGRPSAIDGRTTRHAGYARSQHARPRIEPAFGWLKTIAGLRKVKLRGLAQVDALMVFAAAAFDLIRLPKLLLRSA